MPQDGKRMSKPEICMSARSLSLLQMAANTLFSFATTETSTISLVDLLTAVTSYTDTNYFSTVHMGLV